MSITTDEVRRKAMTLPGNPAGLKLPGQRPNTVERLFPGFTKPGQPGVPALPAEGETGHGPSD
jgi:hypothetical protein